MTTSFDTTNLDVEEMLLLARQLAGQERLVESLEVLKQAQAKSPDHAGVTYGMGAIYAQIQMPVRAVELIQKALELDPALELARFQLGLLLFSLGRLAEAIEAWRGLDTLEANHPLLLFKTGLESFARDDYPMCRNYLERGIEHNQVNEPLNSEMRKILTTLDARGL